MLSANNSADDLAGIGAAIIGARNGLGGIRRGADKLLESYTTSPHIRSVVGRVSYAVAVAQWQTYLPNADQWDAAPSHPFAKLWRKPNKKMSGVAMRRLMQTHLDLIGEAFLVVERNQNNEPKEFWCVPPTWVTVVSNGISGDHVFTVQIPGGSAKTQISSRNMIWIRDPDPSSPYARGSGIGASLGDEIDTDEFASKHVKAWFINKCTPSYLIALENTTDEQAKAAAQSYREKNQGPAQNGRTHFINRKVTATRLDDKFSDMQVSQLREMEAQIIRETYNVPPEVVGHIDNSNSATIEHALTIMATLVVEPRLAMIQDSMQAFLDANYSDGVWLQYDDPTPKTRTQKLEVFKSQPVAFTINEWRELAGEDRRDDGDVYMSSFGSYAPLTTYSPTGAAQEIAASQTIIAESDAKSIKTKSGQPTDKIAQAMLAVEDDPTAETIEEHATNIVKRMGQKAINESGLSDIFNWQEVTANYLSQHTSGLITQIDETTKNIIRDRLTEGYARGESIQDLARGIRQALGFDPNMSARSQRAVSSRARTVARTETLRAANYGRLEAYRQQAPGLVKGKKWLTALDGRQRQDHEDLNGTIVGIDEMFVIGGATAMAPTQFGVPEQDINCRCTILPALNDGKGVTQDDIMHAKSFDRDARYYETQMLVDVNAIMQRQLERVIRIIEG